MVHRCTEQGLSLIHICTKFMADIWQGIGHREKTDDKDIVPDDENIQIQPGRILVVDDNDLNCDVAKGIL